MVSLLVSCPLLQDIVIPMTIIAAHNIIIFFIVPMCILLNFHFLFHPVNFLVRLCYFFLRLFGLSVAGRVLVSSEDAR